MQIRSAGSFDPISRVRVVVQSVLFLSAHNCFMEHIMHWEKTNVSIRFDFLSSLGFPFRTRIQQAFWRQFPLNRGLAFFCLSIYIFTLQPHHRFIFLYLLYYYSFSSLAVKCFRENWLGIVVWCFRSIRGRHLPTKPVIFFTHQPLNPNCCIITCLYRCHNIFIQLNSPIRILFLNFTSHFPHSSARINTSSFSFLIAMFRNRKPSPSLHNFRIQTSVYYKKLSTFPEPFI